MQFDLRKFIATGTQPYHAEFPCDLSARDFAGARIEQPVTASFTAEPDGDEVRMTLRANASVHGECARCLDPVIREETVDTEWTVKERDLDEYKIAGGEMLYGFVAGLMASNYDITDLYIDGILKVLDHDINRLGVVLDEMAAIAGDSVKVTVTVSADEAALPHDVKKYL